MYGSFSLRGGGGGGGEKKKKKKGEKKDPLESYKECQTQK